MDFLRRFHSGLVVKAGCESDDSPALRIITTDGSLSDVSVEPSPVMEKTGPAETPSKLTPAFHSQPQDSLDRNAPYIVRGVVMGTGLVGLAIFARSVRMFTQFEHVRQIPLDFIRKGVRLRGQVSSVEADGRIRVLHQPLVKLPRMLNWRKPVEGRLSISLAGLESATEAPPTSARTWALSFPTTGRQSGSPSSTARLPAAGATIPGRDHIEAEVTARLGKYQLWSHNLNQELVRRGLARVPSTDVPAHLALLRSNPAYSRLVNHLLIAERIADRRGVGMWQRDTWLEGAKALPTQLSVMTTNTGLYRLLVMLGLAARSVAETTVRGGLWTIRKLPAAAEQSGHTYRKAKVMGGRAIRFGGQVGDFLRPLFASLLRLLDSARSRIKTPKID